MTTQPTPLRKLNLSKTRDNLASRTTNPVAVRRHMADVDLSPIITPAKEAGFFVVGVLGSRPKGEEFTPKQPYTWASESMREFIAVLEPKLIELLEIHGQLLVVGRTDGFDAGFAAMRCTDRIAGGLAPDDLQAGARILAQPIEAFATRPTWRTQEWQIEREYMQTNNPDATSGCFLETHDALPEFNDSMDFRAVEWAIAQAADLVLCIHGPNYRPEWERNLDALCKSQKVRLSDRRIQLHRQMPSQSGAYQRVPESMSAHAFASFDSPITQPQENRFQGEYDGSDELDLENMTEEQRAAALEQEADDLLKPKLTKAEKKALKDAAKAEQATKLS